nr:type II CAAX endopeptidase family protein [cf. Phormidesmis sp. LEGE 11477]
MRAIAQLEDKLTNWAKKRTAWFRIGLFLLVLGLVWLPFGALVYLPSGWFKGSNVAEIAVLALLYIGFLLGLPYWGRRVHSWPRPFQQCGLIFQAQTARDLLLALVIGVLGVFALFGLGTLLGWAVPSSPSPRLVRFIFEGLVMALAVGFAEEMLFRGWVLAELEQDYRPTQALLASSLFFAATHFIKPWSEIVRTFPQFLGLVLLGMALVWARRSPSPQEVKAGAETKEANAKVQKTTRLGYPIGLHAGLIWGYYIINVGGLSEYTGRVPDWLTGIDGNPLAGLMGLILLGLIARQFAKTAQKKAESF